LAREQKYTDFVKIVLERLKPFLTFPDQVGMVMAKRKYLKVVDNFAALAIHNGD
jgi:hypothetical protein